MSGLALRSLLLLFPLTALAAPGAVATLKDASGQPVGTATFEAAGEQVRLEVHVHGLKPGPHGFHVHAAASCVGPDFKSAGGHFNPGDKHHGLANPEGHHAGDLPNLTVTASGDGEATALLTNVTLGEGPTSLFHPGGTALVIHADADDGKTDPAGNSGARIACGVVQRP